MNNSNFPLNLRVQITPIQSFSCTEPYTLWSELPKFVQKSWLPFIFTKHTKSLFWYFVPLKKWLIESHSNFLERRNVFFCLTKFEKFGHSDTMMKSKSLIFFSSSDQKQASISLLFLDFAQNLNCSKIRSFKSEYEVKINFVIISLQL